MDHVREGVNSEAENGIISGNQITGGSQAAACCIQIGEKAQNVLVKDNEIRDCTTGIRFGSRHWDVSLEKWIFQPCVRGETVHVKENIFFNSGEDIAEGPDEVKIL